MIAQATNLKNKQKIKNLLDNIKVTIYGENVIFTDQEVEVLLDHYTHMTTVVNKSVICETIIDLAKSNFYAQA